MYVNYIMPYAKSYVDKQGYVYHVKRNQVFPDRALWLTMEKRWAYFRNGKQIPIELVHASQLDEVVPYYGGGRWV